MHTESEAFLSFAIKPMSLISFGAPGRDFAKQLQIILDKTLIALTFLPAKVGKSFNSAQQNVWHA